MTELQKVELDIFKAFAAVCEKLRLPFFLVCGSALGAVKYRGFIPWDDDLDVAMYREDYEVFLEKAPALLSDNLFLQNYRTDPAFPQIFSKLRRSDTTFIEKSSARLPIHHGIYIDIFPLDGYPKDPAAQKTLERRKRRYKRRLACVFDVPRGLISRMLCLWNRLLGCHRRTQKIVRRYEAMVSRYAIADSDVICNHGNWQGRLEYAARTQYGKGAPMTFEGVQVLVPEEYDAYLTQKYGDWRSDPPIAEQVGHHYYEIMDPHRSYVNYMHR